MKGNPSKFACSGFTAISALILLVGMTSGSGRALGQEETASAEVLCIDRAREETLLDEAEADRLCRGAGSLAPLTCFREALDELLIGPRRAVDLCRCARSTAPVQCFVEARELQPSETQETLRLCSPISTQRLTLNCEPIVPTIE